jgi:hypothetical protein
VTGADAVEQMFQQRRWQVLAADASHAYWP